MREINIGDTFTLLHNPYQGLDTGQEVEVVWVDAFPNDDGALFGVMPNRPWTEDEAEMNDDGRGFMVYRYELEGA